MDEGCCRSLVRLSQPRCKNRRHNKKIDRNSWVSFFAVPFTSLLLFLIAISSWNLTAAQTSDSRNLQPSPSDFAISVGELRVPGKAWSHLQSAHKEFRAGHLLEASKEADRALQIDSHCAPAFSMKAFIELAAKNASAAVEDGGRAASLDPYNAEAFVALAMAYNSVEDYRRSQAAARQALSIRPDSWQGRLELAKSLYGQGLFDLARDEINALDKDFPDVHLVRGNILMRLGHNYEGAAEFFTFLREAPGDPRARKIKEIIARVASAPSN
jgi:tetratricopeptide (TPR) repeat protein